jgi:DNA-binding transcriptional regulator YbjK
MQGDLERARDEETKAIAQVERVMQSLSTPEQWSMFLRQYADLYAQTVITDVRSNQDEQARALLQNFVRIAGKAEVVQHIQAYQTALTTEENEMSEAELAGNKDVVKRLEQLLKGLP